jgi:hypothetical protein
MRFQHIFLDIFVATDVEVQNFTVKVTVKENIALEGI